MIQHLPSQRVGVGPVERPEHQRKAPVPTARRLEDARLDAAHVEARQRLKQLPAVTTLFGWSAKSIRQDDNGVRVEIAQEGWPYEDRTLEAEYVVGCDGARSLVREQLGIDRGGADFDQRMVLAVFRSRELHEGLKRFPERTTYRVLKPELQGYWQFFGRVDVGEGWFFHAPVPRETTQENYDFHGLIENAAGFSFAAVPTALVIISACCWAASACCSACTRAM